MPRCHKVTFGPDLALDEGVTTVDGYEAPDAVFLSPADAEYFDLPYGAGGTPPAVQQCLPRCAANWLSLRPMFGVLAPNQAVGIPCIDNVMTEPRKYLYYAPITEIRLEYSYDADAEKYRRRVFWAADNRILLYNETEQDDPFDCFATFSVDNQFESGDLGTYFDQSIYALPTCSDVGGGGCIVSATGGSLTFSAEDCCGCECVPCPSSNTMEMTFTDPRLGVILPDSANGEVTLTIPTPSNACRMLFGKLIAELPDQSPNDGGTLISMIFLYTRQPVVDEMSGGSYFCKWVLEARYIWEQFDFDDDDAGDPEGVCPAFYFILIQDTCWWRWEAPDGRCPPLTFSGWTPIHGADLFSECPLFMPPYSSGILSQCDKTRCTSACDAVGSGDVKIKLPQCVVNLCIFGCTPGAIITLGNVVPCDTMVGNPTWEQGSPAPGTGHVPFDCADGGGTRTCGVSITLEYTANDPGYGHCWVLGFQVFGGDIEGAIAFLNMAVEGIDEDGALILTCCPGGDPFCEDCFAEASLPGPCDDGPCAATCDDGWVPTLSVQVPGCVRGTCIGTGTTFTVTGFVIDADCASGVVTFNGGATVDGCDFTVSLQQIGVGATDAGCWWAFIGGPDGKSWIFKLDKVSSTIAGSYTCCSASGGASCTACDPVVVTI